MFDLIILGSGPAGLTAGIYASRAGLKTAIVEKKATGGTTAKIMNIQNYPGFLSIDGFELTNTMAEQCKSFGVEFVYDTVEKSVLDTPVKCIHLGSGKVIESKAVIVATGSRPKKLGVTGEIAYLGKGLSYCATCDGNFFRNKDVAVVGGGQSAVGDALYLANLAASTYLIADSNSIDCDKNMRAKLEESGIKTILNSKVEKIAGTPLLSEITLKDVKTGSLTPLLVNGLFVSVGHTPETDGLDMLLVDALGYIITNQNMETNLDLVFAVGDIRNTPLRQIVTACADGAIASEMVIKALG